MKPSREHLRRASEFASVRECWNLLIGIAKNPDDPDAVEAIAGLICDSEARGYCQGAIDQRKRPGQHVEQTVLVAEAVADGRL